MSAKHTPGPWIWGDNYNGLFGAGPENEVLSYAGYEGMWLSYEGERKANAALIAASPDLLQALQLLQDDIAEYARINNLGGFDNHVMKLARAAIAKATGEQP
jgi:hypothetical protein